MADEPDTPQASQRAFGLWLIAARLPQPPPLEGYRLETIGCKR